MPRWFRLDCDVFRNPKIAALSPAERCIWLESIAYAAEHATDGRIPDGWLENVARAPVEYATTFVQAGLWRRHRGGGFVIHDYLQKQMSKDYWESRKTAGRKGAEKRWAPITSKIAHPENPHNDAGSIAPAMADANATKNDNELDTPNSSSRNATKATPKRRGRAVARDAEWSAIFAALADVIGTRPATKSEQGVWAHAVDQLRAVHATPDQVIERATAFTRRYNLDVTPPALARHWGALGTQPAPPTNRFGTSISIGGEAA